MLRIPSISFPPRSSKPTYQFLQHTQCYELHNWMCSVPFMFPQATGPSASTSYEVMRSLAIQSYNTRVQQLPSQHHQQYDDLPCTAREYMAAADGLHVEQMQSDATWSPFSDLAAGRVNSSESANIASMDFDGIPDLFSRGRAPPPGGAADECRLQQAMIHQLAENLTSLTLWAAGGSRLQGNYHPGGALMMCCNA